MYFNEFIPAVPSSCVTYIASREPAFDGMTILDHQWKRGRKPLFHLSIRHPSSDILDYQSLSSLKYQFSPIRKNLQLVEWPLPR